MFSSKLKSLFTKTSIHPTTTLQKISNPFLNSFQSITTPSSTADFHSASKSQAGQKFRLQNGISRSNTEYGPLVDSPDWSFIDGTPAPETPGMMKRRALHKAIGTRIREFEEDVELIQSIDRDEVEALDRERHAVDREFVEKAVKAHKIGNEHRRFSKLKY